MYEELENETYSPSHSVVLQPVDLSRPWSSQVRRSVLDSVGRELRYRVVGTRDGVGQRRYRL
jgi:hypothetical protein